MRYRDILGQPALVANLRDSMQSGRAVHAYFFSGPFGTGKRTLAAISARALVCGAEAGIEKPCDICPACRRALAGTHLDIITMMPEKTSIGVNEVRGLLDRLSMRAYEAGCQVVIIQRAETLTTQAQNALLKTLESPPGEVVFFLLSELPHALLPTVLSRVMTARFTPIAPELVEHALLSRGVDPNRAGMLANDCDGSVGRALMLNEDASYFALRREAQSALNALAGGGEAASIAAPLKAKKDEAQRLLDIFERLGLDGLRGGDGVSGSQSPAFAIKLLRAVIQARKMIKSNVAWAQVIELLFMDIGG